MEFLGTQALDALLETSLCLC